MKGPRKRATKVERVRKVLRELPTNEWYSPMSVTECNSSRPSIVQMHSSKYPSRNSFRVEETSKIVQWGWYAHIPICRA